MNASKIALAILVAFAASGSARAGVDLIAVGKLDASGGDLATRTAAPLENGVPGNLLGGLGSGLAYAGCDTFLGLPDRGPNANAYNAASDDTTSYIDRFQTLSMTLAPNVSADGLPYTLTPQLTDTTLLADPFGLYYGNGRNVGLPSGRPSLNRPFHNYFTGRSDNALRYANSTFPLDARLDPEALRVSPDGRWVYISDEYGPYVYKFDRRSGLRVGFYQLPAAFAVHTTAPVGDTEIAANNAGRTANKGMEGLAISPDGSVLFGIMQAPLIQDGGTDAGTVRIARIDLRTHRVTQYAYPLTQIGTPKKPKFSGVSEIVAVNDHQFLVDERDGKGFGDGSTAKFKHLFLIDLNGATEVGAISGAASLAAAAVIKTDFLDIVTTLGELGIGPDDVPAKLEGLAFGPDVPMDGVKKHTLFIANDNDFLATVTDDAHPEGASNPNQFFVFAFGDGDLPGYQPQRLTCASQGHGRPW